MRPVQLADIEMAARVLLAHDPGDRVGVMAGLLHKADTADHYRKRTKKQHPSFGCGTLMSAAAGYRQAGRPAQIGPETLSALRIVIESLLADRNDQNA